MKSNNDLDEYRNIKEAIKFQDIKTPNMLEAKIRNTVEQSSIHKKMSIKNRKIKYAVAITTCLLIICVLHIQYNEAFADSLAKIPVVKELVKILRDDKGYEEATSNGYQQLDFYEWEKSGYKIKFYDMYIDEERIIYTANISGENVNKYKNARYSLNIAYNWGSCSNIDLINTTDDSRTYRLHSTLKSGQIKDILNTDTQTMRIDFNVLRHPTDTYESCYVIDVPLDKTKILQSKVYDISDADSIIIDDTSIINLDSLAISPTTMRINFNLDDYPNIFRFKFINPYLLDEKGNRYEVAEKTVNHIANSIYYIPSLYYKEIPHKLFFGFDGIRVMNRDNMEFTISENDSLPKIISYSGTDYCIEELRYEDGYLTLSISPNGRDEHVWIELLSSKISTSFDDNKKITIYETPKKEQYTFRFIEAYTNINLKGEIELELGSICHE